MSVVEAILSETKPKTGIERRRDRRYPHRASVVLSKGSQEITALCEDVSFNGLFLRSDMPVMERWLIRLRVPLAPDGHELSAMGMVARVIPARDGRTQGVGILLYALAAAERRRWNEFVKYVASTTLGEAPAPAPGPAAGPAKAPAPMLEPGPASASASAPGSGAARRHDPRHAVALQVRVQTSDDLLLLYTRNVSRGGLFVGTTRNLPDGSPVRLSVIHPRTREHFTLEAVVRWHASSGDPGIGLEFVKLTDRRRDEFLAFISSELLVEEVLYVSSDDRHLQPTSRPG